MNIRGLALAVVCAGVLSGCGGGGGGSAQTPPANNNGPQLTVQTGSSSNVTTVTATPVGSSKSCSASQSQTSPGVFTLPITGQCSGHTLTITTDTGQTTTPTFRASPPP